MSVQVGKTEPSSLYSHRFNNWGVSNVRLKVFIYHQLFWILMSEGLYICLIKICPGTSLVVQWLRIRLPKQGTRVRALVQEDPTCRGATKPVHHNYWAGRPRAHALPQEKSLKWEACTTTKSSPHSPQLEKARAQQRRTNRVKNK